MIIAYRTTSKMCKGGSREIKKRVSFQNDHPCLMKPTPTEKYIFEKNGLISNFVRELVDKPVSRPKRLHFSKSRTLTEIARNSESHNSRTASVTSVSILRD